MIKGGLRFDKRRNRWVVGCRKGKGSDLWARVFYQNYVLNGEEIPKGYHIHHINGDSADDRVENLEMMTHRQHCFLLKHSMESKRKIQEARLARKMKPESIEKTRQFHLGRKRSIETRERISKALSGRVQSPEQIEKSRLARLGKPQSSSHKEAIQLGRVRKKQERVEFIGKVLHKIVYLEKYGIFV